MAVADLVSDPGEVDVTTVLETGSGDTRVDQHFGSTLSKDLDHDP